jgi:serine/threonine protein kinase
MWDSRLYIRHHNPLDISPEMLKDQPYDYQVDMWSFGIIMFELITCYSPFSGNDTDETISKVKEYSDFNKLAEKLKEFNISLQFVELLSGVIQVDPGKRLTIEEVLKHKWIGDGLK